MPRVLLYTALIKVIGGASQDVVTCAEGGDACDLTEIQDMKTELLQHRSAAFSRAGGAAKLGLDAKRAELLAELEDVEGESTQAASDSGEVLNITAWRRDWRAGEHVQLAETCSGTCGGQYDPKRSCQCNKECERFNSCCADYKVECLSCSKLHCPTHYVEGNACQCSSSCEQYGNCCSDYKPSCTGSDPPPAPAPEGATDAPAPSPSSVGLPKGHPKPGFQYPTHPGFTLWLVEEFDHPLDLDNDPIWTWSDGGLREGQVRFVKEGITFDDGVMKIEVRQNDGRYKDQQPCSHAATEKISHKPLTSGELRSKHNLFRYGRYEMRFKAPSVRPNDPSANGNYIATMFIYRDINMEHWREIDWEITADGPHAITTNVLQADHTSQWNPGIQRSVHGNYDFVNSRADFHEYAFEWLPDRITWYIDGRKIREHKAGSGNKVPDMSSKIMMNLWIFGNPYYFGGSKGYNNRYPFHSEYDWFRFYKWDGDFSYPCEAMDTSCLNAANGDMLLSGNNPCDGIEMVGRWPYGKCSVDKSHCHR